MNFTREPIIETIITSREGCKLSVCNSKNEGKEEYTVDAVEIVSFGHAFFFRSLEKPKPFLVPASDYEVTEVKEARIVLKNASLEKSIKIGGGFDASFRGSQDSSTKRETPPKKEAIKTEEESSPQLIEAEENQSSRFDKKRDRRRNKKRRPGDEKEEANARLLEMVPHGQEQTEVSLTESLQSEPPIVSMMVTSLPILPIKPPELVSESESLKLYKMALAKIDAKETDKLQAEPVELDPKRDSSDIGASENSDPIQPSDLANSSDSDSEARMVDLTE